MRRALFTIMLAVAVAGQSISADIVASEYQLKAEYVWRFTLFIEWPSGEPVGPDDPFVIGVVGPSPITAELETRTRSETIGGRPVHVREIAPDRALEQCDIVFIPAAAISDPGPLLTFTDRRPILTIGEREGFAEAGVLVNLYREGDTVRFEINRSAAERSGLSIGSKLLKVARIVEPEAAR